jgi:hypothetical protein
VCNWNALGHKGFPKGKLEDSNLTVKLFEQNSNLEEDAKFQIYPAFKYVRKHGLKGQTPFLIYWT